MLEYFSEVRLAIVIDVCCGCVQLTSRSDQLHDAVCDNTLSSKALYMDMMCNGLD